MGLNQQSQRPLHNCTLGRFTAGTQRFRHQGVVDVDVGSHASSMCKNRRLMCMRQVQVIHVTTMPSSARRMGPVVHESDYCGSARAASGDMRVALMVGSTHAAIDTPTMITAVLSTIVVWNG